MNTCENHTTCIVVYISKNCPFCEAEGNIETLEQENADLEQEVGDLQQRITD
ncbi:hypothetical protein LCGC14_0421050 [marine sediment metagenome]|uniref:Uncharacterized protein n=1 Tax=marine sediment metagenome TaxID=412755 RepID=A0A0F9W017_9ZZZZ